MNIFVVIAAIVFAIIRSTVKPGLSPADTFKDLAHVFVGGVGAAWFVFWWLSGHEYNDLAAKSPDDYYDHGQRYCYLFWALVLFEVFCAIYGKVTSHALVNFGG